VRGPHFQGTNVGRELPLRLMHAASGRVVVIERAEKGRKYHFRAECEDLVSRIVWVLRTETFASALDEAVCFLTGWPDLHQLDLELNAAARPRKRDVSA
jgi:hypothetical protein